MSSDDVNLDDLELELRRIPGVRAVGFSERDDLLLIELHVTGRTTAENLPVTASRIAFRHTHRPVALELVRWRDRPATAAEPSPARAAADPGVPGAPAADAGAEPEPGTGTESAGTPPAPPVEPVASGAPSAPSPAGEGARVRLLAVLTFPDTDELEVHLTYAGRRSIGRAAASDGLLAAVSATLDGLGQLVTGLEATASWVRTIDHGATVPPALVACELKMGDGSLRNGLASGASILEAAARSTLHALNRTLARAPEPVAG